MEPILLFAAIDGVAYPFSVREMVVENGPRMFEVKDLFSLHQLQRGDNGQWQQVDGAVEFFPQNLQSVGQAIENYYGL